ncbi:hypothetical protein AVEN_72013-1 [Araneus ventricosus]|uniref:Uncharacterized protein n=1 Tax=Araneus ventricosus TaxID=182803 RepID=A0A4Y2DFW8_ARAVE|nr:hypothetical protein AVEN_72013-1 [Araneus ventricosus]
MIDFIHYLSTPRKFDGAKTGRRCEKPVRFDVVWRERLDIQPISISITPFGQQGYKLDGRRYASVWWRGDLWCVVHRGNRRRRGSEIGVTDCGWICVAWSGR